MTESDDRAKLFAISRLFPRLHCDDLRQTMTGPLARLRRLSGPLDTKLDLTTRSCDGISYRQGQKNAYLRISVVRTQRTSGAKMKEHLLQRWKWA
jgi:hypothetical protein